MLKPSPNHGHHGYAMLTMMIAKTTLTTAPINQQRALNVHRTAQVCAFIKHASLGIVKTNLMINDPVKIRTNSMHGFHHATAQFDRPQVTACKHVHANTGAVYVRVNTLVNLLRANGVIQPCSLFVHLYIVCMALRSLGDMFTLL